MDHRKTAGLVLTPANKFTLDHQHFLVRLIGHRLHHNATLASLRLMRTTIERSISVGGSSPSEPGLGSMAETILEHDLANGLHDLSGLLSMPGIKDADELLMMP